MQSHFSILSNHVDVSQHEGNQKNIMHCRIMFFDLYGKGLVDILQTDLYVYKKSYYQDDSRSNVQRKG